MSWYVFALVDTPARRLGRGLRGPLRARPLAGAYAIVERRADVPPAGLGTLRAHQAVVARVAKAVPAILPVRFGTLLDDDALEEALADRNGDVADALAVVRHRVQFTWRRAARGARSHPPAATVSPSTGTSYLRRAAKASAAVPPAAFRLVRDRLHAFVVRERFQPAAAGMPDTLYQLVDKTRVRRYRTMADALTQTSPALTVSGPWPPFAFAPELL